MKADHRKELQTNTLADYIGNALQHAKEGPSQKTLLYGGLIVLVVALVGLFVWFSIGSKDKDALRWDQLNQIVQGPNADVNDKDLASLYQDYNGKSPDWVKRLYALQKFEAENSGTPQARMARFWQARLFMDKPEFLAMSSLRGPQNSAQPQAVTTRKCIEKARDIYEKLIDDSSDVPTLAEEAIYNAAKANEDLGDFKRARDLYDRLKRDHPKSQFVPGAEKAVTRLSNEKDMELLKNLVEQQ